MKSFQERLYRDHSQVLSVEEILHRSRSRHQDVLVFTNRTFGRVLVLDGVVQVTELDSHIYHEMIAHVPLAAHWRAEDVLILGGGDGGTLCEVLKHPVRRVMLVELDEHVIDVAKTFLPSVSRDAFADPRAEVVIEDAAAFVGSASDRFDVIIIDSTDPVGPGERLFSDTFYRQCRRLLRMGGIVTLHGGTPFYRPTQIAALRHRLADCFGAARPFFSPVPTYASGMLALFAAGSSGHALCPPIESLEARFGRIRDETRFYCPEIHRAGFAMVPSFAGERPAAGAALLDCWRTGASRTVIETELASAAATGRSGGKR